MECHRAEYLNDSSKWSRLISALVFILFMLWHRGTDNSENGHFKMWHFQRAAAYGWVICSFLLSFQSATKQIDVYIKVEAKENSLATWRHHKALAKTGRQKWQPTIPFWKVEKTWAYRYQIKELHHAFLFQSYRDYSRSNLKSLNLSSCYSAAAVQKTWFFNWENYCLTSTASLSHRWCSHGPDGDDFSFLIKTQLHKPYLVTVLKGFERGTTYPWSCLQQSIDLGHTA